MICVSGEHVHVSFDADLRACINSDTYMPLHFFVGTYTSRRFSFEKINRNEMK